MGYEAINPTATKFYRGVISNGGARSRRGFRPVEQPPGTADFVYEFELPVTPDIPEWVGFRGDCGGGMGAVRPPTYQPPALSISVSPVIPQEVGTTTLLTISPTWAQKNAGTPTAYRLTIDGVNVWSNATPVSRLQNFQWEDNAQTIQAAVDYAAGPILNDSLGNPSPGGQILAGTISSNTVSLSGFRQAFFSAFDVQGSAPTTSAAIRAYTGTGTDVSETRQIIIPIISTTKDIIVAFPAVLGNIIEARFGLSSAFDQSAAFQASVMPVPVEGANGYTPINYNVFHWSTPAPYGFTDTLVVTIQ